RLARPVGAEKAEQGSFPDSQGHVVDCLYFPIGFRQVLCLQNCRHGVIFLFFLFLLPFRTPSGSARRPFQMMSSPSSMRFSRSPGSSVQEIREPSPERDVAIMLKMRWGSQSRITPSRIPSATRSFRNRNRDIPSSWAVVDTNGECAKSSRNFIFSGYTAPHATAFLPIRWS